MEELKIGQMLYWARILHGSGTYDLYELKVCTIHSDWFVCFDKRTKQRFLFNDTDIDKIIFFDRSDALETLKQAEAKR